jgi:hypothetical protein
MFGANIYKPSNRSNICLNCGDVKGNCRTIEGNDDLILCRKVSDAADVLNPEWTFGGMAVNGIWGKVYLTKRAELTAEEKREYAIAKAQRLAAAERSNLATIARLPKIEQRDREYRQKIINNPVTSRHRDAMTARGMTDADIKTIGAYSTMRGITIPVRNLQGQMVGAQVKPNSGEGYRWDSIGQNKLNETGQLPLTFWGCVENPRIIILVEGLTFKPYFTHLRYPDCLIIGASGGLFGISSKSLLTTLELYPDTKIVLMPDAGAIQNADIVKIYESTARLLRSIDRELLIGWWGQTTKAAGDIDEILPETLVEVISWNRFMDFHAQSKKVERSLWKFANLRQKKRSLATGETVDSRDTDLEYKTSQDLEKIYSDAVVDPNIKAVLDISITGSGKSTLSGNVRSVAGIENHLYVSSQHRNPTTPEVEIGYTDVPSRHNGLFVNPDKTTPLGNPWLQNSQPAGEQWERTISNCHLADEQQLWRELGHADISENNPICGLCPHNAVCHYSSGDGFGYKHQRNSALAQSRLRISPMALPNPQKHDYSKTLLIWDDQEQALSRKITANSRDIDKVISQILTANPELAIELEPIFSRIKDKFEETSYYGHDWHSIANGIEIDDPGAMIDRVTKILSPDLSKLLLNPKESRFEKWGFTVNQNSVVLAEISTNWLVSLLEILSGKVVGTARIDGGTLTVKQKDTYHQTIADKAALTVVLNATKSREDLALELGIERTQVRVISQPVPSFDILTIHMVDGLGNPTKNRCESMNNRIDMLGQSIAERHGDCSTIDKLKDRKDRALWFRDSVGSNAFKHDSAILIIGAPTPNLGAMADEFTILTGRITTATSKDWEFLAFLKRQIAGHTIQAIGRARAQHRSEAVNIYIACDREDFPISEMMSAYPGAKLTVVSAEDLCLESASSRTQLRVKFAQLKLANPNITRADAAIELCVSKSTLTAMFKEFGLGFKEGSSLLYKALYSKLDLLNSALSDWSKFLDADVVDHVCTVLDSTETALEVKAGEVAAIVAVITSHQLSALWDAIGVERTDFAIDLLRYRMHLLVPAPSQDNN